MFVFNAAAKKASFSLLPPPPRDAPALVEMRSSLLLLLQVVVTTHSALGFVSFAVTRPLPRHSLAKPLAASSTPTPPESSISSSSSTTSSGSSSSSSSISSSGSSSSSRSRQEYLRGFLAAATGAMTTAAALDRVPRIAQAVSADDVDPDKPQTVRSYLEEIDAYNLKAPEFPKNLEWVNTGPLSFQKDLRGKVALLDFWCYCCINCMHTLPSLASLEKKYADTPFQVIGVRKAMMVVWVGVTRTRKNVPGAICSQKEVKEGCCIPLIHLREKMCRKPYVSKEQEGKEGCCD